MIGSTSRSYSHHHETSQFYLYNHTLLFIGGIYKVKAGKIREPKEMNCGSLVGGEDKMTSKVKILILAICHLLPLC